MSYKVDRKSKVRRRHKKVRGPGIYEAERLQDDHQAITTMNLLETKIFVEDIAAAVNNIIKYVREMDGVIAELDEEVFGRRS